MFSYHCAVRHRLNETFVTFTGSETEWFIVVEVKMCPSGSLPGLCTVCVEPAGRLRAESHTLLFDVLRSDRMWQRDDGFLLCVSGQSFSHV